MDTTTSGAPLQTPPLSSKPTLIPQLDTAGGWTGKIVKVEQVLLRGLGGGARMHFWVEPDPRPHNHPWDWIDCKVIHGGYRALEYRPVDGHPREYIEREVELLAGMGEHRLLHREHHQIVVVIPGTVSVMTFGPVVGDGRQWGHLFKEGGHYRYEQAVPMGGFVDALRHCNAHVPRPPEWADPYVKLPVPALEDVLASRQ